MTLSCLLEVWRHGPDAHDVVDKVWSCPAVPLLGVCALGHCLSAYSASYDTTRSPTDVAIGIWDAIFVGRPISLIAFEVVV